MLATPKLLDRYLFRQMLDYFLLGVVIFTLIAFFSDTLLKFIREIQKYGIAPSTLLTMIGLQLPRSIALVIPASAFLAVLMVFNQLSNQFEIIAMRMNGISLWRLSIPALILGLVCSGMTYLLGDYVVPWCNIRTDNLKRSMMRSGSLPPNGNSFMYRTFDEQHNLVQLIYVNKYHRRTLGDSTILDLSKPGLMQVLQSRAGKWDPDSGWDLRNVNAYVVSRNRAQSSAGHLSALRVNGLLNDDEATRNEIERLENEARGIETNSNQQNFAQLKQAIERRELTGRKVATSTYLKLWDKITYPISCFVIILSAIPLALTPPRQNDRRSFVFAIVVLFLFYQLDSICNAVGHFPVPAVDGLTRQTWLFFLSWLPIGILAVLGSFMLQRKSRVL